MTASRLLSLLLAVLLAACSGGGAADSETAAPAPAAEADEPVAEAEPRQADEGGQAEQADGAGGTDRSDAAGEQAESSGEAATRAGETVPVTLVSPAGDQIAFEVELAVDPPTRQRGLMERTDMAEDAGMLFLFPSDGQGGFWMKNTLIPLQIAYIDANGVVVSVLDMVPCTEEPCEVYSPGATYRSALEVNAKALDAAGVEPGWRLEVPDDLPAAS